MGVPTKWAADEEWVVDDGVETLRGAIGRIAVAAGVEAGQFETNPVAIVAEFERGHVRVDVHLPPGEAVEFIFTQHMIVGMRNVEPSDVTVAGPAEIERLYVVPLELSVAAGATVVFHTS